jgi:predicted nucleic acid-binding protein
MNAGPGAEGPPIRIERCPVWIVDHELASGRGLERPGLSARDALHAAVMDLQRIEVILSFDAGFDGLPGIQRLR